jgi:hypothetical protein
MCCTINFSGRGMMRGGGFSNGPMNGRGGMMRGGRNPRGPPRMGLGYNNGQGRGMNPRGRGRGGFQGNQSGDYFPNQQTNENVTVAATENIPAEKPAATASPAQQNSGNNVQVVTSPQPINTQPPQSAPPQTPSIQSSSIPPSRGAPRGRGFSRGSFSGRGRGNFNQGMPPRQQFDTRQPSNLTPALPPKMSRYDQGSMPPKRGRYDNGPYMGNRGMSQNQPPPPMQSSQHHQGSYNNMPQ